MSLGLYIDRASPIHQLPVGLKLLSLAAAGIVLFLVSDLGSLTALLLVTMLLWGAARLPRHLLFVYLRPSLPLLLILFAIQAYSEGWQSGLATVLRFSSLLLLATLVSLTTRLSAMLETIEQILQPLRLFGVNPAQIGFMLLLAIRFIPVLLDQFQQIQEAQRARGLDRHPVALLVPFLVRTLRMADELTDALDARCYGED